MLMWLPPSSELDVTTVESKRRIAAEMEPYKAIHNIHRQSKSHPNPAPTVVAHPSSGEEEILGLRSQDFLFGAS